MNDQFSFNNIDKFLFQLALQTRELSQKKNEINQQIKVFRADIAERTSYIETLHRKTKKLEEEIRLKQNTASHNKANAKRIKATNSLLLQYEQTMKEELESRKASYSHDMDVYEERIASYRKIFQSHKEYYYQNPLAQRLLTLQAEKEETESRIKARDDQITMKQKKLDHLSGPAVNSPSIEKLPDSASCQQHITKPEKQLDPHTVEDTDSSIDVRSLHLNLTKISQNDHEASVDANAEEVCRENKVQDTSVSNIFPKEASNGLQSCQQLDDPISRVFISTEQRWQDVMQTQEQETGPDNQVLQSTVSAEEQEEMEGVAMETEQASSKENEQLAAVPESSSQETIYQSSSATVKAVPSTPMFSFNFSPGGSPNQGTSDTKSPAFLFSLNSDPTTSGFSGFGFDDVSSHEDSSFAFTSSFFTGKKTTESKSSSCPEFLFGQPEQSEDFQFAFMSKSPQTANKDNTGDDFPFPFNF